MLASANASRAFREENAFSLFAGLEAEFQREISPSFIPVNALEPPGPPSRLWACSVSVRPVASAEAPRGAVEASEPKKADPFPLGAESEVGKKEFSVAACSAWLPPRF